MRTLKEKIKAIIESIKKLLKVSDKNASLFWFYEGDVEEYK